MRPREEIEKAIEDTHYQGVIVINAEILLDIRDLLNDIVNKGTIWTEIKEDSK